MNETANGSDVKMVVLKCPNCGANLSVSPDHDSARCEHCGSTVLILDAGKGAIKAETKKADAPIDGAVKLRAIKALIIGIVASFVLPFLVEIIVFLILGVVFVVLGIVFFWK